MIASQVADDPPLENCFLITGNYGVLFGGPSFRATVYSMHEPKLGGASCAQACVFMVLGLLADRGAHLRGSYSLTYLGKSIDALQLHTHDPSGDPPDPPYHLGTIPVHEDHRFSFPASGTGAALRPPEIARLLKKCGVSSSYFKEKDSVYCRRLVKKLIGTYVAARFPVLLAVDTSIWYGREGQASQFGHTIVAVGIRRWQGEDAVLIVHDPGYMPYHERYLEDCLSACSAYDAEDNNIIIVFSAHLSVKRHAYDCIRALKSSQSQDQEFIERLLNSDTPESDYRIDLIVRDELQDILVTERRWRDPAVATKLRKLTSRLPRARYWCISAIVNDRLVKAWLFNSQTLSSPAENYICDASLTFEESEVRFLYATKDGKIAELKESLK